ncbi:hypothetical protein MMR14E_25775 [Methylobacterium mesophilicum]
MTACSATRSSSVLRAGKTSSGIATSRARWWTAVAAVAARITRQSHQPTSTARQAKKYMCMSICQGWPAKTMSRIAAMPIRASPLTMRVPAPIGSFNHRIVAVPARIAAAAIGARGGRPPASSASVPAMAGRWAQRIGMRQRPKLCRIASRWFMGRAFRGPDRAET